LSKAPRKAPANVVGPQVQKLRYELGLTQEKLAARCQLAGLDISRATLAQIETRLRCVTDLELFLLARVLKATTDSLSP
jgi:transcriptional regulator with XRE-family HTH domain